MSYMTIIEPTGQKQQHKGSTSKLITFFITQHVNDEIHRTKNNTMVL